MEKVSLSNMDAFKITDSGTGEVFYGCSQEWFGTDWQKLSGCGPSVVTNILMYQNHGAGGEPRDKASAVSLMEEVWKFVTPTRRGIPTVGMLLERVMSYGESRGVTICHSECDVPEEKSRRPSIDAVSSFLGEALGRDAPVAFLNLCKGEEHNLDEWHWVTVVSVERRESDGHFVIGIIDKGHILSVDMSLWLETTSCGGGFIHFRAA